MATLPVYLNALTGKGVHVVTVNDYLARRDSEWMGKTYRFLGLTVGLVTHECPDNNARRAAYAAVYARHALNKVLFQNIFALFKQSLFALLNSVT